MPHSQELKTTPSDVIITETSEIQFVLTPDDEAATAPQEDVESPEHVTDVETQDVLVPVDERHIVATRLDVKPMAPVTLPEETQQQQQQPVVTSEQRDTLPVVTMDTA